MNNGIFGPISCVNDMCGPNQIASHLRTEEDYCSQGLYKEACVEGCIIRTKNLAAALFCPVNGAYTFLNGLYAAAYPIAGSCCWLSKSCCKGFCPLGMLTHTIIEYLSANTDLYCDATCPLCKITCLQTADLGLFALKCPGSIIAPELQKWCCHPFEEPLNEQIEKYNQIREDYINDMTPSPGQFP